MAWLSGKVWRGRMVFATGAVAIGIAAVIFAWSADLAGGGFELLRERWPLLPLFMTPVGFATLAWITKRWFPGAEGSGIPQAIAARRTRDASYRRRLLGVRVTLGKIILTVAGLAIGASIGREGPTVQVGASVMLMVAGVAGIGATRGLVLAGGAAGVAAAFNTPLAGVVFAIEEMAKAFEHRFSGPILGAVVLAGLTGIALIGDYRYFGHASTHLAVPQDWLAVPVCGIVCGTLGGLFSLGVLRVATARQGLLAARRTHTVLFAFACGILVAGLGWLTDGYAHGTSYDVTRGLIDGGTGPALWAAPLKLLATLASSVSGIPGGLFAPSLSVGAGLGPALGHLLPDMDLRALSLLAMVGYFAGVVQAPLTAFVIVLEMIDDSRMVVPLMATALLATGASRLICPHSLYHTLSRGYDRGAAESTEKTPLEPSRL
ncbi:MAG: chloride channel protein [Geminicoccaceae bacterium]